MNYDIVRDKIIRQVKILQMITMRHHVIGKMLHAFVAEVVGCDAQSHERCIRLQPLGKELRAILSQLAFIHL